MAKATCPKCGNPNAKANARGPDHVWCKPCGGLVPVNYTVETFAPLNDPVRSAIKLEEAQPKQRKRWMR